MEKTKSHECVGDYVISQRIGAGSFAVVWKGKHKVTGLEVAIKEIPTEKLNKKLLDSLESEISILEKSNHPNIVKLLGKVECPDRIYLILEYCSGGDLSDFIRRTGKTDESTVQYFMRQLGAGLKVLRAHNLIHRDLKPQNLLLSSKGLNAVLKIADFGFARSLHPQGMAETLCGSPLYMAPEILQFQRYDAKADLWSVGAILFELLTGRPPFGGQNHVQLLRNIERKEVVFPENVVSKVSPSCIALCKKLLQKDPVQRLSFEEFFMHPFMGLARPAKTPGEIPHISHPFVHNQKSREEKRVQETSGSSDVNKFCSEGPEPSLGDGLPFALEEVQTFPSLLPEKRNVQSDSSSEAKDKNGGTSGQTESPNLYSVERESSRSSKTREAQEREGMYFERKGCEIKETEQSGQEDSDMMRSIEKEYVMITGPVVISQENFQVNPMRSFFHWKWPSTKARQEKLVQSPKSKGRNEMEQRGTSPPGNSAKTTPSSSPSLTAAQKPPKPVPSIVPGQCEVSSSVNFSARILTLKDAAHCIGDIAISKKEFGNLAEALSLHLLALATWRKALEVCQTWATSAPGVHYIGAEIAMSASTVSPQMLQSVKLSTQALLASEICSEVEKEFFCAVERAEAVAALFDESSEVDCPEPVDVLFESAISLATNAAVEELMGNIPVAEKDYLRSTTLLNFILEEAPKLALSPPFVLFEEDRARIGRYISSISLRHLHCSMQSGSAFHKMV